MPTDCDLRVAKTDRGFVIRVEGRGTSLHSRSMENFVRGCFADSSEACVVIDLCDCEYLDSTFLGCLLYLQRAGKNDRFHVVAPDDVRQRLLVRTKIDKYLSLVDDSPKPNCEFIRIDTAPVSPREMGRHMKEAHEALAEIPSDFSIAFKRIASQLECELKGESASDRNDPAVSS